MLELFQQVVGEIKLNGGRLIPDIALSIPAELVDLFAQFIEIFTGVEAANVITAIGQHHSAIDPAEATPPIQPPDLQGEIEVLWDQVLDQLKLQMTRNTFDTWLKDTQLIAREGSKFTVAVSSRFAKDWLENRLLTTIQRTLVSFIQTDGDQRLPKIEIRFVVTAR
jgi:hypothetical protein